MSDQPILFLERTATNFTFVVLRHVVANFDLKFLHVMANGVELQVLIIFVGLPAQFAPQIIIATCWGQWFVVVSPFRSGIAPFGHELI